MREDRYGNGMPQESVQFGQALDHPKGDQTEAIAMEYVEDKPTGRKVAGSLAKVRESTPTGAVMLTRSSQDDPSIIESWVFPPPGTQILGP